VPAGVLVLVVLGAIALDFAVAFLGQRELSSAAAAAANDVAAVAVSDAAFYSGAAGPVTLDAARAERVAAQAIRHRRSSGVEVSGVSVEVDGLHACVRVVGRVAYLFAPVVPGVAEGAEVRGRAVATAVVGPTESPVPAPAPSFCD
jgi:hypothetical protein